MTSTILRLHGILFPDALALRKYFPSKLMETFENKHYCAYRGIDNDRERNIYVQ